VKSIGVSNFEVGHLEEILSDFKIKPAVNQIQFHPYNQQPELVKYCHDNGILVAGMF
jgi:diketogulonate reductase-like aldo/keto reductase